MKKAVSVLRWHSIYADVKPKLGDKCLISDDDGNIRLATYCYLSKPNVKEDGYYFFDILDGIVNDHVYCWAKIPEILSDIQLNNIDERGEVVMTEKVNNESDKEITVWPESFSVSASECYITCKAGNGTHEKVYVLRNSQAHEFFLQMTRMAPVAVTITVDPNSFNMVITHARWDNKEYIPQHQRYL